MAAPPPICLHPTPPATGKPIARQTGEGCRDLKPICCGAAQLGPAAPARWRSGVSLLLLILVTPGNWATLLLISALLSVRTLADATPCLGRFTQPGRHVAVNLVWEL